MFSYKLEPISIFFKYALIFLLFDPNEALIKSEKTITFLLVVDDFFNTGEIIELSKLKSLKSGCNISKQEYTFPTVGILFLINTSSILLKHSNGDVDFNI